MDTQESLKIVTKDRTVIIDFLPDTQHIVVCAWEKRARLLASKKILLMRMEVKDFITACLDINTIQDVLAKLEVEEAKREQRKSKVKLG